MAQIPLSLVTGFLGSGKTTFLRHVAHRLSDRRIVYLVNEFSSLDVDGAVLGEIGPNVICVPGGSIFCRCLVGEFIDRLLEIPRRFGARHDPTRGSEPGATGCLPASASFGITQASELSTQDSSLVSRPSPLPAQDSALSTQDSAPRTQDSPIEGVLVEASGIADPKVVADMLAQTKLDRLYSLASIVSIVEPGSFHKLLVTLPNIRAQVEAADTVLLNKIDLFDEPRVAATEAEVRQINPHARIIRTVRGAADIDLFGPPPARDLHGEYAPCADPHYARLSVTFSKPVDLERLRQALRRLGEDLYRAKGFVPTASGTVYLDLSSAGLSVQPCDAPAGVQHGLAIIGRGDSAERIEISLRQIQPADL